ncbi:MAG: TolC family protein [Polyangia bacterium]
MRRVAVTAVGLPLALGLLGPPARAAVGDPPVAEQAVAEQAVAEQAAAERAAAERAAAERAAGGCAGPLEIRGVVRCALSHSLEVRAAREAAAGLLGQRRRAAAVLPAQPVLAAQVADRRLWRPAPGAATGAATDATTSPTALNWYLTLSQELEIAGQRGARLAAADAAHAAQLRRIAVAEQEAAAAALVASFELLAAEAEVELAARVGEVASALSVLSAARARESLAAPIEADVAAAEATRLLVAKVEAERARARAGELLGELLGQDAPPRLAGTLDEAAVALGPDTPPGTPATPGPSGAAPEGLVQDALRLRGELAAAEQERRSRAATVSLLRRLRVPNLTLSAFMQSDGFDERVLGGGLSLPLPLPLPLGPGRAGEIASAEAEVRQAETALEKVRRRVRLEVQRALLDEEAYGRMLRLYPQEAVARATGQLVALRTALEARQIPVREALLMQRSLLELLQGHLRARLGLALARIERRRAAGLPLLPSEGGK